MYVVTTRSQDVVTTRSPYETGLPLPTCVDVTVHDLQKGTARVAPMETLYLQRLTNGILYQHGEGITLFDVQSGHIKSTPAPHNETHSTTLTRLDTGDIVALLIKKPPTSTAPKGAAICFPFRKVLFSCSWVPVEIGEDLSLTYGKVHELEKTHSFDVQNLVSGNGYLIVNQGSSTSVQDIYTDKITFLNDEVASVKLIRDMAIYNLKESTSDLYVYDIKASTQLQKISFDFGISEFKLWGTHLAALSTNNDALRVIDFTTQTSVYQLDSSLHSISICDGYLRYYDKEYQGYVVQLSSGQTVLKFEDRQSVLVPAYEAESGFQNMVCSQRSADVIFKYAPCEDTK
jgi:hypothetical protein